MELPKIPHPIRDAEMDVTYVVMAYRELTRPEVVQMVRVHQAQKRAKPKRKSRIVIYSTFGMNGLS